MSWAVELTFPFSSRAVWIDICLDELGERRVKGRPSKQRGFGREIGTYPNVGFNNRSDVFDPVLRSVLVILNGSSLEPAVA